MLTERKSKSKGDAYGKATAASTSSEKSSVPQASVVETRMVFEASMTSWCTSTKFIGSAPRPSRPLEKL
jgi:hypothetical protein